MKLTKFIMALSFIPVALACPDLAGDYQCVDESETYVSTISQQVENGVMTYTVSERGEVLKIVADGKKTTIDMGDDTFTDATQQIFCSGSSVVIKIEGKVSDAGTHIGDLVSESSVFVDGQGDLQTVTNTTFNGNPLPPSNFSCERI